MNCNLIGNNNKMKIPSKYFKDWMNQVLEIIFRIIEEILMSLRIIKMLPGFHYKIKFLVIECSKLIDNLVVPLYLFNQS